MSLAILQRRQLSTVSVLAVSLLLLSACNVHVKKDEAGDEKNVDIETPIGGIHVDKHAGAVDTGLAAYPGAHIVEKENDGDSKSANVNLSAFGFGLRVAAVDYQSDDPPAKVADFYRKELKKYGSVLECHTSGHANVSYSHPDNGSKALTCEQDSGTGIELKTGNEDNQRIVSVEPRGTGSKFALVHVQMRGKDTI